MWLTCTFLTTTVPNQYQIDESFMISLLSVLQKSCEMHGFSFLTSLSIGGLVGTLQQMARIFFVEKVSPLKNYKQLKQPGREFWQRVSESLSHLFFFVCLSNSGCICEHPPASHQNIVGVVPPSGFSRKSLTTFLTKTIEAFSWSQLSKTEISFLGGFEFCGWGRQ